jgi:hypothetical protein
MVPVSLGTLFLFFIGTLINYWLTMKDLRPPSITNEEYAAKGRQIEANRAARAKQRLEETEYFSPAAIQERLEAEKNMKEMYARAERMGDWD